MMLPTKILAYCSLLLFHFAVTCAITSVSASASDAAVDAVAPSSRHRRTIVGGVPADPAEYPYFVRLDYDGYVGCGASLIHREFILTAAHCVPNRILLSSIEAFLIFEDNEIVHRVTRRIVHPDYDNDRNMYDAAIVQISPPAPEGAILIEIGTASSSSSPSLLYKPGDTVTVLGYGVVRETPNGGGRVSDILRKVELTVVNDAWCDALYGGKGEIHASSMICAADPERGPCYRDSGGPLLVKLPEAVVDTADNDDLDINATMTTTMTATNDTTTTTTVRHVQIGIVSSGGDRCGDANQPSVYMDVIHVSKWIQEVLCPYQSTNSANCSTSAWDGEPMNNGDSNDNRDASGTMRTPWKLLLPAMILSSACLFLTI